MKVIPKKCDVLVIGGGPAGAMASALLAKKGIDVVLLEKEKFPRYAVGESLIPHFWKFLDLIGASEAVEKEGFIKKEGGFVHWDGILKTTSFKQFGHTRPGLHVERSVFDNILLNRSKALGAKIFESVKCLGIIPNTNYHCINYFDVESAITRNIQAKYVIDASGQNAVLAKQFQFREFNPNFKFQAFWGYFDKSDYFNSEGIVKNFEQRFDIPPMTFVTSIGHWGWIWKIVLRKNVSVGIVLPKNQMASFKLGGKNLEERYINYLRTTPLISTLLQKGQLKGKVRTIRDYAYYPKKLAFDRCFLTGDAAAFVDPINSGGITIAMYGATLAAWAINNSLKNQERYSFYESVYKTKLEMRLRLFELLSFPSKSVPSHLIKQCKKAIRHQSKEENYLTLAQLVLSNRSEDFPQLMNAFGISPKEVCQTISIPNQLMINKV